LAQLERSLLGPGERLGRFRRFANEDRRLGSRGAEALRAKFN